MEPRSEIPESTPGKAGNQGLSGNQGSQNQFTVITHGAFADFGVEGVEILVGRNVVRAGDHAITATYTEVLVVDHRTLRGLGKGPHQAGRGAGGLFTVSTLLLHKE